jgi:hypothetical protein
VNLAAFTPWTMLYVTLHVAGAIAAATVAFWLAGRRERFGDAGAPVVAALALTAVWSIVLAGGFAPFFALPSESARNLAWLLRALSPVRRRRPPHQPRADQAGT